MLRGHRAPLIRMAVAKATAATTVVWPLGKDRCPSLSRPMSGLKDQVRDGDRGHGADDGEQHAGPTPDDGSSGGNGGDEDGGLAGVPEADQGRGDGLVPVQGVPDQRIEAAVEVPWHVLIGIAHPENGNHGDRQPDHKHRRTPHPLTQQRSVPTRITTHRAKGSCGTDRHSEPNRDPGPRGGR
jgi:hypothetical protein